MIPTNTLKQILEDVVILTRKKAIDWSLANDNSFRANFSRSSIALRKDDNYSPPMALLALYNDEGEIVGYVAAAEVEAPWIMHAGYLEFDVEDLFEMVKSQVYKASETASSILEDLTKLKQSNRKPDENLPFAG